MVWLSSQRHRHKTYIYICVRNIHIYSYSYMHVAMAVGHTSKINTGTTIALTRWLAASASFAKLAIRCQYQLLQRTLRRHGTLQQFLLVAFFIFCSAISPCPRRCVARATHALSSRRVSVRGQVETFRDHLGTMCGHPAYGCHPGKAPHHSKLALFWAVFCQLAN